MDDGGKICAEILAARQRELGSKIRVFCVEETGSTNTDVARMLAAKTPPQDFALVANTQSAGRGRVPGRCWTSRSGNILLSCGFRPPKLAPSRLANFTLWFGVSVAKMLREKFGVPAKVKWPNDIFCRGKKMAGMLTEAHLDTACVHGIVFGIGLNVNLDCGTLPEDVRGRATSLREELGGNALDVNRVCAELLFALENAYAMFLAGTHTDALHAQWQSADFLAGKKVTATFDKETLCGIACGIDAQGRILIKDAAGTLHAFAAGDVTLSRSCN